MGTLPFVIFLLALVVLIRCSPADKPDASFPLPFDERSPPSPPEPFNPEEYKTYINNLNCSALRINHFGLKFEEVATGSIYLPSTPFPPFDPYTSPQAADYLGFMAEPTKSESNLEPSLSQDEQTSHEYHDTNSKHRYRRQIDQSIRDGNHTGEGGTGSTELPEVSGMGTEYEKQNIAKECTAPLMTNWTEYNWYQILLDNGGAPGTFVSKGIKAKLFKVLDPCFRPVWRPLPIKNEEAFRFTYAEFEKVYRSEQVEVMFAGTSAEFLDVTGQLVWAPPHVTRRYFHITYRKDDSGLYVQLSSQRCVFHSDFHVTVKCEDTQAIICECHDGKEHCFYPSTGGSGGYSPGLDAALVGGG